VLVASGMLGIFVLSSTEPLTMTGRIDAGLWWPDATDNRALFLRWQIAYRSLKDAAHGTDVPFATLERYRAGAGGGLSIAGYTANATPTAVSAAIEADTSAESAARLVTVGLDFLFAMFSTNFNRRISEGAVSGKHNYSKRSNENN
jgi:hypothetical protein